MIQGIVKTAFIIENLLSHNTYAGSTEHPSGVNIIIHPLYWKKKIKKYITVKKRKNNKKGKV